MPTTDENTIIKIDLTPEQKQQIKEQTGRDADSIKLAVNELETRIAPKMIANHNEVLLIDPS